MLQTLTARRLLTPIGTIEFPVITIDPYGLIADISSDPSIQSEDILTPTFLDIHIHGCASHDIMEATPAAFTAVNTFLATRGVGRYLPTTVTAPIDPTLRSLEDIATAIEAPATPGQAIPIGIHLEGPFISHAKRGVHPVPNILAPDIALFDRFHQAARGHIRIVTIAPETPNALDLIRHCTALGIKVSLGHSNATTPETLAAIEAGAASATHTFNAMRALDHRAPGILGTVLDDDRLFADLICDGIHVAPELVRLWLRMKGEERAILITDGMSATGMPDGIYTLGNLSVEVANNHCLLIEDGVHTQTLAGSVLTMDQAVANLQRFTGASLATAIRLATHNPATLLGLPTHITPGQPASFNRFSPNGTLQSTILQGHQIPTPTQLK
ncbi:N-acetylglucosamine-6-phosphate deacetylase [Granulicella sp. dw_53]|uniref:N-acetylglucosamine-6-phosphate deacetylase n=1 Tax=Granulicella sp. dw_53 TaxID=2719792 RepID=UPI001BD22D38|nr:N-acetylglucosamine-6-phosphate deacetylase [Granulicella sp. dw_53]